MASGWEGLARNLLCALTLPTHSTEATRLGPASGLLVDWLETLDPEVVCSCPDLQRKLLFSRRKVTDTRPRARLRLLASRERAGLAGLGPPVPGGMACLFGPTLAAVSGTGAAMGVRVGVLADPKV